MQRWLVAGCLVMALGTPVLATEPTPPGGTGGTVTIPLQEFMQMTHPTQAQHASAPMPYILSSGAYRLTPQDKWVQVEGLISLRLYSGGWVEVPLMATGVVVAEATLDGKPLPLYQKDEKFSFVASGVGTHVVRIRYHLPLALSGATQSVEARLPLTSVSTATLTLPETQVRVSASPNVPLESRVRGQDADFVEASIPSTADQSVTLSWTPERTNPLLHGKLTHQKPSIQARTFMLVTVSDKLLRTHTHINCSILRNEADKFTLDIPAGTEVVDLQCAHLNNYNVTDEKGYRRVNVSLSEPVAGQQAIDLTTEQPVEAINGTWEVPTVGLEEAERVKGSIGIETTGGIEVTLADKHDVRGMDVKELPAEVTGMATSPVVLAFEYHKQPYHLALESQKGEEMAVLTATIDTAEGLTLVTPEGKTVTRMTYMVRNNLKQNLTLKLPLGATVWSAYVNGEPVKPVKTTDGAIKLPLLRSQASGDGMATFPAELTFVTDGNATSMLGQRTMTAPECDVPISQLSWSVYMPRECKVMRFGGTMQPATPEDLGIVPVASVPVDSVSVQQARENTNRPAPAASRAQAGGGAMKADDEEDKKALAQMVNTARQGAFPVRVFVPEVGSVYHFSSLMVAGQMPTVVIYYSDSRMQSLAGGGLLLLGLLTGAGLARRYHWGSRLAAMRHRLNPIEPSPSTV